jgi:hypothetical protein
MMRVAAGRDRVNRPRQSTDPALLGELLALHHAPCGTVADMSWGLGKLWSRELLERYRPVTVDLDPRKGAAVVGDWAHQSDYFAPASIATELWDPSPPQRRRRDRSHRWPRRWLG